VTGAGAGTAAVWIAAAASMVMKNVMIKAP
jgi:hypothetical protein